MSPLRDPSLGKTSRVNTDIFECLDICVKHSAVYGTDFMGRLFRWRDVTLQLRSGQTWGHTWGYACFRGKLRQSRIFFSCETNMTEENICVS